MIATPATVPLWKRMLLRRLKWLAWLIAVAVVVLGGSYLFAPQWLMNANVMREAMKAHLRKHTVQAGDTRWTYYEGGEGPTIVLLHGLADSKDVWLQVAARLTPHFHLIIPDLPGWGESSRDPRGDYDIDAEADRFQAFVQALALRRFVLVGHSMGGAVAGVYAASHPEHVSSLALVDAFGLMMKETPFVRAARAGHNFFVFDDRAGFARIAALVLHDKPDLPGRFVDVLVARNIRDHAFIQHVFEQLNRPSQYLSLQQRLDQLDMPVLGLWCRDDKLIDISALDSLRRGLSHASAISSSTLSGCGHLPMLEKPDETARVLTGFALSH